MRILFLHGWQSTPGGLKPSYLKDHGHEVLNPALPDDDFDAAVRIAQAEFDQHKPDAVVGSSRGGAVAMNIDSGDTPLVLLCPAWKTWGAATTVKANTAILHSRADETVPFNDSDKLVRDSGLPSEVLIETGHEHRLADPESLAAMLRAVERSAEQTSELQNSVHRFVATQVSVCEEVGTFIAGVADQDTTAYFMFQRSLPVDDNEDRGIYVELNDQINSAYETVRKCVLSRDRLRVELSEPIDKEGRYKTCEVALRISESQWDSLADGLKRVVAGQESLLTITGPRP